MDSYGDMFPGNRQPRHDASIAHLTPSLYEPHGLPPAPVQQLDPDNVLHVGVAKLNELRECVDDVSKDAAKFFDKGNKAAGVRARKKLQTLKALAQDLRVSIQKCKAELAAGGVGGPAGEEAPQGQQHQHQPQGDMQQYGGHTIGE